MKSLTLSTRDNYWHPTPKASGALLNVLRLTIAKKDDEEEDYPDNYWHP